MLNLTRLLLITAFAAGVSKANASERDIRNQIALGALAFADNCRQCHQLDGYGEEKLYPSLHNQALLTDKTRLIRAILHGRVVDRGESGRGTARLMPSLSFLTNQEVAAIIAFITNSWGDEVLIVTDRQIDEAR